MPNGLVETRVAFPGDGIMVRGVLVYPPTSGKLPAVIVHPGAGGLTGGVVDIGKSLAVQGYAVLVFDLYSHVAEDQLPRPATYPSLLPLFRAINERSHLLNLDATLSYLQGLPVVRPDRIGVTGFCTAFPLVFACHNPRLSACVSFYNQMHYGPDTQADTTVMPVDRVASLWCPWQGHYGEADGAIPPDQREEFLKLAAKYKKSVDLNVYPGAGHGFAEPGGRAHQEAGATLAWDRTKAFLAKHLKG